MIDITIQGGKSYLNEKSIDDVARRHRNNTVVQTAHSKRDKSKSHSRDGSRSRISVTRKSLKHFTQARNSADSSQSFNEKNLADCLSVNQATMTRIDEELKLASGDGRSSAKVIKMLRNSEKRPPAYFVYNTTQSSEGGSPRRIDLTR